MQTTRPDNRLLEVRTRKGITLARIAAACGVYPSTVKHWQETEIPQCHQATVGALLDVSVPYLTGWTAVEEPFAAPGAAA